MLLFLLALIGPYLASGNFATNLVGQPDTRPETWGTTQSQSWPIVFHPPTGYRVHVLHIRGDLVAWPRSLAGDPQAPSGSYAGVLAGFSTTAPEGSARCNPCADNTPLYVQGVISGPTGTRIPFDADVSAMGLLGADSTLLVKAATWLSTMPGPIHLEITYTVTYRFEPQP